MALITFPSEYFNARDTLECGQIFRFYPVGENAYRVISLDKCAIVETKGDITEVSCADSDRVYFENFFDLSRDYGAIVDSVKSHRNPFLSRCTAVGKGIRILNQDSVETLFSFIVSQNNNIPRIKGILERLCTALGEEKEFDGCKYFAFPKVEIMAKESLGFYKQIGLGYRAEYIKRLAENILNGFNLTALNNLSTIELKKALTAIYGVGPKVADCVCLFGFHRSDSFPVDTWIEKVYRENFFGLEKNRAKITEFFNKTFGDNAGYFQQYMFYYKRSLEKGEKSNV